MICSMEKAAQSRAKRNSLLHYISLNLALTLYNYFTFQWVTVLVVINNCTSITKNSNDETKRIGLKFRVFALNFFEQKTFLLFQLIIPTIPWMSNITAVTLNYVWSYLEEITFWEFDLKIQNSRQILSLMPFCPTGCGCPEQQV